MAFACVSNIGMSLDNFPAPSYPIYSKLSPTRLSFTLDDDYSKSSAAAFRRLPLPPPQQQVEDTSLAKPPQVDQLMNANADPDPEPSGGDFEFCLEDPVAMLLANELFSDGKLVPLQVSVLKPAIRVVASTKVSLPDLAERRWSSDMSAVDLYLSSPKASRGSKALSSLDSSLNMPLLKDLDSDSVMISSHLSLSSSSSRGHEHEEVF
ncbi:hypothetical protein CRG98_000195 [Punica granatum]|uniref:Uncharacterized protein n=1 Tax=Punica granatum TaxID=22663 RepID=A0A2I0LFI5_PUNGR|nr:hypothetical protein CRG98_000195 [Punica granatum]